MSTETMEHKAPGKGLRIAKGIGAGALAQIGRAHV